jgi:ABC-type Zn uptake system ZnuABC Zn-binding protein ZnuA
MGAKSIALVVTLAVALGGLASPPRLVATTSILGDVVREIVGDSGVELTVLLPPDTDPHTYEPTPQEVGEIARADAVFICGAGLEATLEPVLGEARKVVDLSQGIELRRFPDGRVDPHVWMNPLNVAIWAEEIAAALAEVDPAHADFYRERAQAYRKELEALDAWIADRLKAVPADRRLLVVDHLALGYFADRYGFTQIGAVIPGFSTMSEPSAQDLARLEALIRKHSIPALFISHTTVSPLIDQVARDTGAKIVRLYIGALSKPSGPAPSYVELMRYDAEAIAAALGGK